MKYILAELYISLAGPCASLAGPLKVGGSVRIVDGSAKGWRVHLKREQEGENSRSKRKVKVITKMGKHAFNIL